MMLHRKQLTPALACVLAFPVLAQQSQNPSPMVEHTRPHPRQEQPAAPLPGVRVAIPSGTLFVPARLAHHKQMPLFIHFHGAPWLAESAAAERHMAVITVQLGSGSGVYARPFEDRTLFGRMLAAASSAAGATFSPIVLTAWSAGYGAVKTILENPADYARVDKVLLIDGLHTGYEGGKPGPLESKLEEGPLKVFLQFARDAAAGRKSMLITHSEIFPGTFASTTETADWLLDALALKRKPIVRFGPLGTQELSEVREGHFELVGFAGNSAPDHVDQFQSLTDYLKWLH